MTMQSTMKMPMSMPGSMTGMPMQSMMPMMMATMTMKMAGGNTLCEFLPAPGMDKTMFQNSCQMLEMMVDAGMPVMMQAGNMCMMGVSDSPTMTMPMPMMMPMMSMMPSMMCRVHVEMKGEAMVCQLVPSQGMNTDVFNASCKLMEKMMQLGLPMMITCNGSPVMCCTV